MEKINIEIIISSLFALGFDKVDSKLLMFMLGSLVADNKELNLFDIETDENLCETFNKYITCENSVYKFKEGYNITSMISLPSGTEYPLIKCLHTNEILMDYLKRIDITNIVLTKLNLYEKGIIPDIDNYFSNQEKAIIKRLKEIESINSISKILKHTN